MTSFEAGALVGMLAGAGVALLGILIVGWWEERRVERVDLDDAWVRFNQTETSGHRRVP